MSISLPFTAEQFFAVFARYNETVWPMPLALNAAALLSGALLFVPGAWPSFVITLILAALWAWMAIAYHIAFFTSINPAAWLLGMGFLLYGGLSSTLYALEYNETSYSAWSPRMAPIKVIMCLGVLLMLLQVLATFFKDLATARGETL